MMQNALYHNRATHVGQIKNHMPSAPHRPQIGCESIANLTESRKDRDTRENFENIPERGEPLILTLDAFGILADIPQIRLGIGG